MTHSPGQSPWSPTFQSVMESPLAGPPQVKISKPPTGGAPPPTQYEFITQTGDESTATTKKKLKTVRSHVMKNYLHQQQQQQGQQLKGCGPASFATPADRRRGKQRARSSRSASQDTDSSTSPTISEGITPRSTSTEFGLVDFGVPVPTPFSGSSYMTRADRGRPHSLILTIRLCTWG